MTATTERLQTATPAVEQYDNDLKIRFGLGEFKVVGEQLPAGMIGRDEFIAELQSRFAFNVPQQGLEAMRDITAVCIGLGVMGRTMEELARYGVSKFIVVDVPSAVGGLEVSNLNRQVGTYRNTAEYRAAEAGEQVGGDPKAGLVARAILDINPYAEVHAISKILTQEEIKYLLRQGDIAFWGHDDPVGVMHLLEAARMYGIPVSSGLDLASNAYVRFILNDAESRQKPVLDGNVTLEEASKLAKLPTGKLTFLAKSAGIPIERMIPLELLENLVAIATGKTKILSQVPVAVGAFAEETAFRTATVAKEIKDKSLDKKALGKIGLKKDVFFRNWEQNFGVKQRLKRELVRLVYLSQRPIQQLLGYEKGMSPIRYTNMVVRGLFSALIGR